MAKSKEKIRAINLRKRGLSIGNIARKLGVSKSSASLWCGNIVLTNIQVQKLHEQMVRGSYSGRLKGALMQKEEKQKKINYYREKGEAEIKRLGKRELLIAGLGLYWGEGGKRESRVAFYNSNRIIIQFIMKWFREILNIEDERFMMYVTINQAHNKRLSEVKKYWSEVTKIPLKQFRNPILIKANGKKIYENHSHHYGTLCVRISKSSELFYQIMGWLDALGKTI